VRTLRTPDDRFSDLPDFPYAPRYVEIGDGEGGRLRVHHLDEGPADGPVVLLLHGEPTWAYLYRHMVGPLAGAGCRVVVPDLVGFGRSDKPADVADHTYARHVGWMREALLEQLALDAVTLVGQDWGGLIGLRVLAQDPDRFAAAVMANTFLPTGDQRAPDAFFAWQQFARETPQFPTGRIVAGGSAVPLTDAEVAAYDAPFPDASYQAGPRALPQLVPTTPDDPASGPNRRAWEVLSAWQKPFVTAFSDGDPITRGGDRVFQKLVPGAQGRAHPVIAGGGHFLQQDRPAELAAVVLDVVQGLM
jgi:haloalkane dehalogenase